MLVKNHAEAVWIEKNNAWVEIVGYANELFQLPGRGNTDIVTHWMPIPEPAKDNNIDIMNYLT